MGHGAPERAGEKMKYSANSELAKRICKEISWEASVHPLEAAKRGGEIYVRGTALKPEEARELARFCEKKGYCYRGPWAN